GRLRLPLESRQPQGTRDRGESTRGAPPLLARARPPGAGRGPGGAARAGRVGGVLRVAAPRQPALGVGLAAERADREPRRARGGGRGSPPALRRGGRATSGRLGRLSPAARADRAVAAPRGPPARPAALRRPSAR